MAAHLVALKAAIQKKNAEDAFTSLALAWSETRAPELLEVTERLELHFPSELFRGKHKDWMAAANGAGAVARGSLIQGWGFKKSAEIEESFDAMSAWPADPRLSRRIESILVDIPLTSDGAKVAWRAVFDWVSNSGEPRFGGLANRLAHEWTVRPLMKEWMVKALAKAVAPLARLPLPALSEADQALVGEILALLPKVAVVDAKRAQALFAKVYAHSDDDAVRAELAAVLSAANDPRGEFITLQLLKSPSATDKRRIRELHKLHNRKWVGVLSDVLSNSEAIFARGFPSGAGVEFKDQESWDRQASREEWRTFDSISFVWTTPTSISKVTQAMRGVKRLYHLNEAGLEALCRADHDWEVTYLETKFSLANLKLLASCGRVPALEELRVTLPFGATGPLPLPPSVKSVHINLYHGGLPVHVTTWFAETHVKRLSFWDFTVTLGNDNALSRIVLRANPYALDPYLKELEGFPMGAISALCIEYDPKAFARTKVALTPLEDFAKRRGITEFTLVPV